MGQKWELINFCEFDKFAAKSYCAIHHVDSELNLGDITRVDEKEIADFNMICGGSPCQDFSISGKQKGSVWTCAECGHEYNPLTVHYEKRDACPKCGSNQLEKTRSSLLVEFLRIIRANLPIFGIYENVKNITGKKFETTFQLFLKELEEYGYNIYWKVLNAKDYGIPQNRERAYVIFIKKEADNGQFKFPEPFDNGVRLKDLLEDHVDEKFYVSDDKVLKMIQSMDAITKETILQNDICPIDKSYNGSQCKDTANCITSREDRGISNHASEGTAVAKNTLCQIGHIGSSNSVANRVYDSDNTARTLMANAGGGDAKTGLYLTGAIRGRYTEDGSIEQKLELGDEDSSHALTSVTKDNMILQIGNINPSGRGMNGNVYASENISPTLTTNKGEGCKIAIKQATKKGYIECDIGGVADLSFPESKTRRGRVQDDGHTSPTITATETGVCRIESTENISHAAWKQQMYARFIEDADGYVSGVHTNQSKSFGYKPPLKEVSRTLKANAYDAGVVQGIRVRKLTPKECFRLMGFSDEAFDAAQSAGISNSQLYKQAGNSIVTDVLYYIYVELYKAMPYLFDDLKLSSFFSGIGAFEVALDRLYESIHTGNFIQPSEE